MVGQGVVIHLKVGYGGKGQKATVRKDEILPESQRLTGE